MISYEQHPLSAIFPAMDDTAFSELRADIAAHGLHSPIVTFEDKVLDGWHRYRACTDTGVVARYVQFDGSFEQAMPFVISVNMQRRHLSTSQRAMIAGRLATLERGQPKKGMKSSIKSVSEAATIVKVGTQAVKHARVVLTQATPEIIARVERNEITVSRAVKDIREARPKPVKQQPELPTIIDEEVEIAPRTVIEWRALSARGQAAHLDYRNSKATLNRQQDGEDDNLIDWAKWTWNPVTGCNHNCSYCYARDIADRFAGTAAFPNGFEPTLRADRLSAPLNGTPRVSDDPRERRIFTGSMTDLFGRWVPAEWIEAVLGVARQASQWEFLMLTKFPKRMAEFDIPPNVWMGTSVDCQARVAAAEAAFEHVSAKVRWVSVEPMIEPLHFQHLDRFNLVVIGGASPSNRTPQWIPPFEWVGNLMRQADDAGCNVFLKSNLYRKEQPGGPRYRFLDRAPDVFHYLNKAQVPDQKANAA